MSRLFTANRFQHHFKCIIQSHNQNFGPKKRNRNASISGLFAIYSHNKRFSFSQVLCRSNEFENHAHTILKSKKTKTVWLSCTSNLYIYFLVAHIRSEKSSWFGVNTELLTISLWKILADNSIVRRILCEKFSLVCWLLRQI